MGVIVNLTEARSALVAVALQVATARGLTLATGNRRGVDLDAVGQPYMAVEFVPETAVPAALGTGPGTKQQLGMLYVLLRWPYDTGEEPALAAAQAVVEAFESADLSPLLTNQAAVMRPISEGSWFSVPVGVPWRYFRPQ